MRTTTTFTMRDLSRQTARIFAAVRKFGNVRIESRSGEVFTIAREAKAEAPKRKDAGAEFAARFEDLWARQRELGYVPPKRGEWDEERFNRIIAGEE